jgi:NRPS condensation-like uncharacterized protein
LLEDKQTEKWQVFSSQLCDTCGCFESRQLTWRKCFFDVYCNWALMTKLPPLALTPFERYMLADDRPGYPMVAVMELHFGGPLDHKKLRDALVPAIERHPLLTARICGTGMAAVWDTSQPWHVDDILQIDGEKTSLPGINARGQIDLSRSNAAKIHVRMHQNASCIAFWLHHAAADGLGILEFVADWLDNYDRLVKQSPEPLSRPNWAVETLVDRGRSRWIIAAPITRWQALRSFFVETTRWLVRRPTPLRLASPSEQQPSIEPELKSGTLSVEETSQLRKYADERKVTVNDVLLRDLFVAIARWQGQGKLLRRRKWLRVNVPTSLRLLGEPPLPACNVLGYIFLTHRESECFAPEQLLTTVAKEMAGVRRWNLGQMFIDGLAKAEQMPGVVRWFTSSPKCMATTVFSNLGDVRRVVRKVLERRGRYYYAGDAPLIKLLAAPPLRPGTHAVFLAATCGDEITITLRADPGKIAESEQDKLLAMFMDEIRRSLASSNSA